MLCYENWHKTDGLKQNGSNKGLGCAKNGE